NARTISWDEFKERCANPDKFAGDIQREPRQIVIQCSDKQREFVAAAPGEVPLPAHREVVTQLFSDKFHVDAHPTEIELATKGGSCFRFKEVEKTITIEKQLSCDEILGWKGDAD